MSLPSEPRSWTRDGFHISTDKRLLSTEAINAAFEQDFVYWTQRHPPHILQAIIEKSCCFGLYQSVDPSIATDQETNLRQIGFARLVTDHFTFAYLNDLYVLPEYQGLGLGGWLIDCVDEVVRPLPYLRWFMLRTCVQKSKESYQKRISMDVLVSDPHKTGPVIMGRKGNFNTG
ncbi:Acetyltransferase GNAT family [Aspergillus sclerotialis]|uniref:Acetyltransferase GNAT family n=1 Tax=Aspergillus sclerotialis TaxID=2070753 RepID=A0A3A2ZP14_9EURO|nr:Acetyltransferase GNAT family [Aspergillus sclerotialis]